MTKLACGHDRLRVADYDESYRWIVACEVCGAREHWTQRQWRETLLLDESTEGPPLSVEADLDEAPALV